MLLARKDAFLLVADALLGPDSSTEIHYSASLPMAAGISLAQASEGREAWLVAGPKKHATVLPLALPEWRAEFCHANLAGEGGRLSLEQAALGRGLFAPLWIDLDPKRSRRPLTWRQLTVAENLQVVPRDVAVGYRVQVGREQWLIYRSLGRWGNRSVLGQNYATEFVCCRFLPSGKTQDILAIEPA